ncbi:AbrB family transcriptional regulator [Yoonia sp. SS1-5]|uniref:AbrB family transcriptional regulator n=1 Tax=Yoonia rhodophyticola TaxID=3137370 RepID=A0AAN0MKY3_9RHOB
MASRGSGIRYASIARAGVSVVIALWPQVLALGIGVLSGCMAYLVGLPLPWMLGPMIGNTVAALLAVPIAAPAKLRPFVIPVVGVMLGSTVTAEVLRQLAQWVPTLLLLPIFLICASAVSYAVYRRIGGYDVVTAYFSAVPGGLNEMLIVGTEAGGDERRIALAHASRILLVIAFVALFFGFVLGVSTGGTDASVWIGVGEIGLCDYVLLGLCAVLGVLLGQAVRLPAAAVFGPMILSAITHATGILTVAPPTIFIVAAQITIGSIIGARFIGATLRQIRHDLMLAAMSALAMLAVTLFFAELIAVFSGIPLSQAFLAYSPGGLTEMALLTLAMGQNVAYVSIMHIVRITMVIGTAPLVFKWLQR